MPNELLAVTSTEQLVEPGIEKVYVLVPCEVGVPCPYNLIEVVPAVILIFPEENLIPLIVAVSTKALPGV